MPSHSSRLPPGRGRTVIGQTASCPAVLATLFASCAVALSPCQPLAQTRSIERNLPPVPAGGGRIGASGAQPFADEDDTPIGIALAGVGVIGPDRPVATAPAPGLSFLDVEGVSTEDLETNLKPFLGKPLSRKLISDIQAAVAHAYRGAGHPFVSVVAPPQEITGGVLQLRVIPFRTGKVKVVAAGSSGEPADTALAASVRAPAGELIKAERIAEDLDWINRYPYRQLNGVFEPGSAPGSSDLTLEISRGRPWHAYTGASNTGNEGTGRMRYFAGLGVGIEALGDLAVSYQLTGGSSFLEDPFSARLSGSRWPSYLSHAGRIALPLFARQSVEVAPSFVATRQDVGGVFTFHNTAVELPVLYRSALSNLAPSLAGWGEIYGGVTPRWLSRKTRFQGEEAAHATAGVFDLVAGWSVSRQNPGGSSTAFDLRVLGNPGGVVPGNDNATWSSFSNGRVRSVRYTYLYATLTRTTSLGALPGLSEAAVFKDLSLNNSLIGQLAGQALPDTEQFSLGGYYSTRGYSLDDGSVDTGFVLRNDVRLSPFSPLGLLGGATEAGAGGGDDRLQPYAFFDVGHGHVYNLTPLQRRVQKADLTLVGAGAGLDYVLGRHIQASAIAGVALTDGPETERGAVTAQARLTISY